MTVEIWASVTLEKWAPIHDGEVITLGDWALIRRLHASEKLPKAVIARELGISRNTVAKAIASAAPPTYSRSPVMTSFGSVEGQVRQLLAAAPSMPATVLAERVEWTGSATGFRQNVAATRPAMAREGTVRAC